MPTDADRFARKAAEAETEAERAAWLAAAVAAGERDRLRAYAKTLLWNRWLHTPDGKGYEAGWGDDFNREKAKRGKAWVAGQMAAAGLDTGGDGDG